MIETVIRKRIEILVDSPLARIVTATIDRCEISGWTVLPVAAGRGRDGEWSEEGLTGSDKSLVLAIASLERASKLAEELLPLLTSHGLLLTMWDVEVIRGERF